MIRKASPREPPPHCNSSGETYSLPIDREVNEDESTLIWNNVNSFVLYGKRHPSRMIIQRQYFNLETHPLNDIQRMQGWLLFGVEVLSIALFGKQNYLSWSILCFILTHYLWISLFLSVFVSLCMFVYVWCLYVCVCMCDVCMLCVYLWNVRILTSPSAWFMAVIPKKVTPELRNVNWLWHFK